MANTSESMELLTEDGEAIVLTVIKFESVFAFDLMAELGQGDGDVKHLSKYRRQLLSCAYVTRADTKGEQYRIDFAGKQGTLLDQAMDKAFRGTGISGIVAALKFSVEVNYKRFLDEQRAAAKAREDALKQLEKKESLSS